MNVAYSRLVYNLRKISISPLTSGKNVLKSTVFGSTIPNREKHGIRKEKSYDNKWVPKKRAFTDDNITKENKEFLQEVIHETFSKPMESPLINNKETSEKPQWTPESVRTGVIAKKIGIYPMWTKQGQKIICTLLQVVDNHVIRYNPPEIFSKSKYGKRNEKENKNKVYGSLVVGAQSADPQLYTAAYLGLFKESGVQPKKKLTRFRITPDAAIEPGTPLYATHFRVGDYVNVHGTTKYHGFQGVMKRWNFKGGPRTHGCTKSHRRPGCIGGGRKRGVWKGKKMPGLMGGRKRLMVGLKVCRINTVDNVIYVNGPAVPGVNGNYCYIYDCYVSKKAHKTENPPPFPTISPESTVNLPENFWDKELHNFSDPSVTFEDDPTKTSS